MSEIAYLNGKWMSPGEATVPAEDRGYNFGDGLYEVMVGYNGRLWGLERHLLRLERGMREIELTGITIAEVRDVINEAVERSGMDETYVYVQLSRGVATRKHDWPDGMRPSLFLYVRPRPIVDDSVYTEGVATITTPEIRWGRCDIKSINLLPNCLAQHKARAAGAYDAIFITEGGTVTEGAQSSLFIVADGTLVTREDGPHILPGITQGLIVETAHRMKVPVERRPFTKDELLGADEAFLTVSTRGAVPIATVDGARLAGAVPGPITKQLSVAYWQRRDRGDDAVAT